MIAARSRFVRIVRRSLAALALLAAPLAAQAPVAPLPFGIGERLEYDVKLGPVRVGRGSMEVAGLDTVRGIEAWRTVFKVRGGTFFFRVDDQLESWIDPRRFVALRHVQRLREGSRRRDRTFEIIPEQGIFRENDDAPQPTVAEPLDETSFLYYARTIPLETGRTYDIPRYFRPDRNPVTLRVLRRERVTVPAGTFDAVVVQPIIKTPGLFSENGRAEIWFSDDARRLILQMKSRLAFGSLNLYLRSHRATATGAPTSG